MQIPMKDPKVNRTCSLPFKHLNIVMETEMYRIGCLEVKAEEVL